MKIKRVGETKECTQCGQEYQHFLTNKYSACKPCRVKIYNAKNRLKEDEYKKPYPFNKNEQKKRYTQLRRGLEKLEGLSKEERAKYWDEVFEHIHQSGLWTWCTDLRHPIPIINKGSGKRGRKGNNVTDAKLKHPDTRGIYEER